MRAQSSITTTCLVPLISLILAPSFLTAQADKPQPRVIGPDEGHGMALPHAELRFKVGSISTGSSQFFVGLATFPPGTQTPTHLHEVDEEVVYVLEGEVTVTLDGEQHVVGPGGTVFILQGFG